MARIKIVKTEIIRGGEAVRIELKNAPPDYKYIFLDANDLPTLADVAEKI